MIQNLLYISYGTWGLTTPSQNTVSSLTQASSPKPRQKGKPQYFSLETCKGHTCIWPFLGLYGAELWKEKWSRKGLWQDLLLLASQRLAHQLRGKTCNTAILEDKVREDIHSHDVWGQEKLIYSYRNQSSHYLWGMSVDWLGHKGLPGGMECSVFWLGYTHMDVQFSNLIKLLACLFWL